MHQNLNWTPNETSLLVKVDKLVIFGIFNNLLSTQNVNVARSARIIECDFFCDFQTLCKVDLIAGAECEYLRFGFKRLLDIKSVDIIRSNRKCFKRCFDQACDQA